MERIIIPIKYGILSTDVVKTWVEFPDVWALHLVVDVLFKA